MDRGESMASQPDLFADVYQSEPAAAAGPPSIDERFATFHAENPDIYAALRELALAGRRRGLQRLGMKSLFEVVRWNRSLETSGEPWKLNNSYTSRYARLLMENEPTLAGIFELRTLHDEDER